MSWQIIKQPESFLFDLPIVGEDFANIGRIITLASSPCSPTAELWVYGFFQAFPTLFISLVKPDLIDINIKKGGHRPRKAKRVRFKADAIFRDAIFEIPVPNWRVFRLYEFSQRVGWYFMVADASEKFLINWMSTAYMWNGCKNVLGPYGIKEGEPWSSSSSPTPTKMTFAGGVWNNMVPTPNGYKVVNNGQYRCSWALTFGPRPTQDQPPYGPDQIWLVYEDPGGIVNPITQLEGSYYGDGTRSSSGQTEILLAETGGQFYLMMTSAVARVWNQFGFFSISEIQNDAIGPDP